MSQALLMLVDLVHTCIPKLECVFVGRLVLLMPFSVFVHQFVNNFGETGGEVNQGNLKSRG